MQQIDSNLKNATEGKLPELEEPIPDFVTKELILEIIVQVGYYLIENTMKIAKGFLERGEIVSRDNPEFIKEYDTIDIVAKRVNILQNKGFDEYEDHPLLIYRKALKNFSEDKEYDEKIKIVENKVKELLKGVFEGELTLER